MLELPIKGGNKMDSLKDTRWRKRFVKSGNYDSSCLIGIEFEEKQNTHTRILML